MGANKTMTGYPSIDKPWLKYYSEEAKNAPLPECTVYEYLWENNKDHQSDIALVYYGRNITYRTLFRNIDICAKSLLALGVKEKEIVTIALPSIPEALYLIYAINKIGAVANMIHPLAGERELVNYLNEVKSRFAFIFDGTYKIIKDHLSETSLEKAVVITAGSSLPSLIKHPYFLKNRPPKLENDSLMTWMQFKLMGSSTELRAVKKDAHTLALISHTGGTTGEPKGVMCSDHNLNALMYQIVCNFKHTRGGTCLSVLPPFINYSLVHSMMAMLVIGYKSVLIPNYNPLEFAAYAERYKPNIVLSIPPYWEALLRIDEKEFGDLSCLEQIYYGGETMDAKTEIALNKLIKAHGAKTELCKGLGATELMGGVTQSILDCNPVGSVGIPLVKMNCKIVEMNTVEELKECQIGEVCFTGPTLMMGYYGQPEETANIIKVHADGKPWLHMGDLGYIDENGILYVTGRIRRIIMTKGRDKQVTKLFPDRIEKELNAHPAVQLSCVIGVPDPKRINYPKAVIELEPGFEPSKKLKDDIRAFCVGRLPEYQIPDEIEFVDALPRTDRGKVDYRALEKRAEEGRDNNEAQ